MEFGMGRYSLSFQQLKDDKGSPCSWIQVFKTGEFEHPMGSFQVDNHFLETVFKNFYELKESLKSDKHVIPIDYNHAGLADGDVSIAAGWVTDVEIRDDGLYAKVEWTKKAAEHIKNGEFKYISPEFSPKGTTNEFGDDIEGPFLHAAALTNRPFLGGMADVNLNKKPIKGEPMTELFKVLNCKDEKEATERIAGLQKSATELSEVRKALKLSDEAPVVEAVEELKEGKEKAEEAVDTLKEEVETLTEKDNEAQADVKVEAAEKAGKVTAATREWAKKIALKDPESFDEFVKSAPTIVELKAVGSSEENSTTGDAEKDFQEKVSAKAAELCPENPMKEWAKAYKVVRIENPKLAQASENARRLKVSQGGN